MWNERNVQPISQWSSTHVVEWMAALNLYRYAELFRSKDIKGVDLLSLDKDKLTVISSFSFSFFFSFIVKRRRRRWTPSLSVRRDWWDLLADVCLSCYPMALV